MFCPPQNRMTLGTPIARNPRYGSVSRVGLMTTTPESTALVTIQPTFTDAERLALAGFLAGYRGLSRDA
jgi:hypothetical protein